MYQVAGLIALVLGLVLGAQAYDGVGGGFWGWVAGFAAFVATGWGVFILAGLLARAMSNDRARRPVGTDSSGGQARSERVSGSRHSDSAFELREFVQKSLLKGEIVAFTTGGGVVVGEIDMRTEQLTTIDQFGLSEGWLAVTDNDRVIYGRFGHGGQPERSSVWPFTTWDPDPRGLVFHNEGIDPEGLLIFRPQSRPPAALHSTLTSLLGNSTQIRELQRRYATDVSLGATTEQDYAEINRVYGMLRDRGADADQALVDKEKAQNSGPMAVFEFYEPHLDPEAFDSWRSNRSE